MVTARHHTDRPEGVDGAVPLSGIPLRRVVTIRRVHRASAAFGKLLALGLVPGTPLAVVAAGAGGSVVVEVGGSRLALDRECAASIEVGDGRHGRRNDLQA